MANEPNDKGDELSIPLTLPMGSLPGAAPPPPPPPAPPLPPAPSDKEDWPWLGSTKFWVATGILFVCVFLGVFVMMGRVSQPDALVPVVSLNGPVEATKGESLRYSILVRDRHGAPIPNASVRLGFFKTSLIELAHGTTGPGGDLALEIRYPDDFAERRVLVAVAEAGVTESNDKILVEPRSPGEGSMFVSTDKPMYQPGQTVHARALVMSGDKPLADAPTTIEIATPDNTKVFRSEVKTSAFGIVSADFVLADQVKLGTYTIYVRSTAVPKTETKEAVLISGHRTIDVKRYSLPKLKLALEDVSTFTPDSAIKGVVRATWIFGEPVTKGEVRVVLGARPPAKGQLDKNGTFKFEIPPAPGVKPEQQPRGSFSLTAYLSVEGGLSANASKTVSTRGSGTIKLEAFPESGALVQDVAQTVWIVTSEHEQKAGITVKAKNGEATPVQTNDRGIAALTVKPVTWGRPVELQAFSEDGSEGKLEVSSVSDVLVVRPDRPSYTAGEQVKVTVLGANTGDHITIRMTKGPEPIVTGACHVTDAAAGCETSLALPTTTSGLAWVHALSLPVAADKLGHRIVKSGKRLVLVGSGSRDLDLRVTPDKKVYAPREIGNIDVAVTAAGGGATPIKAQLGVAVADEAVFALADVRPDLEKAFFTVDKDVVTARQHYSYSSYRYSSSSSSSSRTSASSIREHSIPSPYEVANAYDGTMPIEVRSTILSALTTMPEAGGFANEANSNTLMSRAYDAIDTEKRKLKAWGVLLLTGFTIASFLAFCLYGVARFRRPLHVGIPVGTPGDEAYKAKGMWFHFVVIEMRGLMLDWLIAIFLPPILAFFAYASSEFFNSRADSDSITGAWFILGGFAAYLLLRTVLRVRRVMAVPEWADLPSLRRVLTILPFAVFLGHFAIVFVLGDRGRFMHFVVGARSNAVFVPVLICGAVQITFGLLSVIRQTLIREVSRKGRWWLFLSRACFLGLPFTIGGLGLLVFINYQRIRTTDWTEAYMEEKETEQVSDSSADNKEGGTGTRAKGEEGSMGNPSVRSDSNKRYGVKGPSDEETAKSSGGSRPLVVRDYFPETLLWAPDVITDDAGHASIKVPLADSITTWRFGLRAVSKTGQLGSTTAALVVKQDFFVDASLPPILTQGDEIAVPVTVFSYTEGAQDVSLELEADGISMPGQSKMALHLEPRESRGVRFLIRADKAGDRTVKLKAISATRSDAIEKKIIVTPNGLQVVRTTNGRLVGSTLTNVELPKNAIDGGNDLSIKVYGGPLSQVIEGLDGVFRMPSGCFEQTSSTTYPSILVLDFLKRTKTVNEETERKARDYISQGYQRLVSFEVPGNGGFSMFGKDPGAITLTAYGLMEFADMARVANVDERLISRTRDWLFTKRSPTGGWKRPHDPRDENIVKDDLYITAYTAWAIATSLTAASSDGTSITRVADKRLDEILDLVIKAPLPEGDDPYALALRANALLAGGRDKDAVTLLDRLAPKAIRDDEGVHFTSASMGVMYSYGSSLDIEVTGLATHAFALAKMQPELRNGALDWLVKRRSAYGTWSTTQATIAAMRALLDEAKPAPKDPQDVTVLVDGEAVETYKLEPKSRDVHHLISLRRFATASNVKHVVELRATGTGDVSYQLVAQHYLPWQRPTGAGLTLDVAYGPHTVQANGTTTCNVRLAWNGKEPARMPLVEIGVPPAFEAEVDDLETMLKNKDSGVERYTIERGKVSLYLSSLAKDKPLNVDLRLRALRPAKVIAPASNAYLYYEPEIRMETAPVQIRSL